MREGEIERIGKGKAREKEKEREGEGGKRQIC